MPSPIVPITGRQHSCQHCGHVFRCVSTTVCTRDSSTRNCPKCAPKAWQRCASCSGQFHDGVCQKCQLFHIPAKTYCPACGKKFFSRHVQKLTCTECSNLPFAVTQSLINERNNHRRERLVTRSICGCNNCRG